MRAKACAVIQTTRVMKLANKSAHVTSGLAWLLRVTLGPQRSSSLLWSVDIQATKLGGEWKVGFKWRRCYGS